ncbi:ATP-binding protein [Kitasatospora sp. NPDC089797]|uniref:ATP-binding protein n=1 Tax=Kitasatospora sp. NPDC089797 TaxID=3155298 RepID=UPI003430C9A8
MSPPSTLSAVSGVDSEQPHCTPAITGGEATDDERVAPAIVRLPYQSESVAAARRFVGAQLREWGLDDVVDDAAVIVSELATNSLRTGCHTRMLVGLRHPADHIVRILVGDGSRTMPVMLQAGPDATSGRGLALVHRLTRGRWGVALLPHGKVVHADLAIPR